jgi:hypothetical protein
MLPFETILLLFLLLLLLLLDLRLAAAVVALVGVDKGKSKFVWRYSSTYSWSQQMGEVIGKICTMAGGPP